MNTDQEQYEPGVCNIGPREVAVRKKFFRFFMPFTILLTAGAIWYCHSLLTWFLLLLCSFSLLVLYFEIKYRFCILFGFFGLHNFEKLGTLHEIENKADIRKDRSRVFKIVTESLVIALVFSTAIHFLSLYIHPY